MVLVLETEIIAEAAYRFTLAKKPLFPLTNAAIGAVSVYAGYYACTAVRGDVAAGWIMSPLVGWPGCWLGTGGNRVGEFGV